MVNDPGVRDIFDAVDGPNQKYARLQLWLSKDLDLAIASASITPQVKNSDEAKLVIRQWPIYTSRVRTRSLYFSVDTEGIYDMIYMSPYSPEPRTPTTTSSPSRASHDHTPHLHLTEQIPEQQPQ